MIEKTVLQELNNMLNEHVPNWSGKIADRLQVSRHSVYSAIHGRRKSDMTLKIIEEAVILLKETVARHKKIEESMYQ